MGGSNSKWDREVPTIKELIKRGLTQAQMAEHFNADQEYFKIVLKRLRKRGVLPSREVILNEIPELPPIVNQQTRSIEISFPDRKEAALDWRQFLGTAIELQKQKQEKSVSQLEATIRIYTDKPFGISFTSDWHIGSDYVDYGTLLSDIDLWLSTPNLFVGLLGDHTDNFVTAKIKSGMFSALFGPQDQVDVGRAIFTELGKKILFKESGNHEGFTRGEAGIDISQWMYEGAGESPYLREGGGINVIVNDTITYRIYAKHKYRFFSKLNPTNADKRMHDLESPFDVGVIGHYHFPTIEHTQRWSGAMGKEVIYIITGTYKVDDVYARAEGFGARGFIGCPTVVFFPDRKKMVGFRSVEDAAAYLKSF